MDIRKKKWEGKYVFVRLKSGTIYTGYIIEEELYSDRLSFLTIIDKFKKQVTFPLDEIQIIRQLDDFGGEK